MDEAKGVQALFDQLAENKDTEIILPLGLARIIVDGVDKGCAQVMLGFSGPYAGVTPEFELLIHHLVGERTPRCATCNDNGWIYAEGRDPEQCPNCAYTEHGHMIKPKQEQATASLQRPAGAVE